jgi:hypothetical protein
MRRTILVLALVLPAALVAWPQPGEQAPSITLPDTAYVMHTVPSDYAHHVVHICFWYST